MVHEDLVTLQPLAGGKIDTDNYGALQSVVNEYGGFGTCSCIVTDSAKSMTGSNVGLDGLLTENRVDYHTTLYYAPRSIMW